MSASLDAARHVADAVRDEGYLLYPYRSTSRKNQARWQFGVLGPPGAAAAGTGEESHLSSQVLVRMAAAEPDTAPCEVMLYLRFLQLRVRKVERLGPDGFVPVEALRVGGVDVVSWDEAADEEIALGPLALEDLLGTPEVELPVGVEGGEEVEALCVEGRDVGRVVRTRWPLRALVHVSAEPAAEGGAASAVDRGLVRLRLAVENVVDAQASAPEAIRRSFLGTHVLLEVRGGGFVSLVDAPADAEAAAAACVQHRCWPVLAGRPGADDVVLVSPIILEDHPQLAEQSAGELFDSTEIDEILTLRVMTMTDEEKAQARATDPRAAEIIDRCSDMSPGDLMRLHGVLRNPHALTAHGTGDPSADPLAGIPTLTDLSDPDVPWWDPGADSTVQPETDVVMVGDVAVSKGSRVRLRPTRRADAQDLFYSGRTARVTAVLSDVDGGSHVAVVVDDDPAAELHDWYGRYLYYAPDELEPLPAAAPDEREENRP